MAEWIKFYYANPQPERFVDEVRALVAKGVLDKPPTRAVMATFLGRVMAANPSRVSGWLAALGDLDGVARETLHAAAWLSQTSDALAWMQATGADPRMAGPAPDALARVVDHPAVLDILWAYFFATGDPRAVRRIVTALAFMPDLGAAARFETTAKTPDDEARALRDGMFQAASWSLIALATEHPPLVAIYEQLVEGNELAATERVALAGALQKLAPDRWSVEIDPKTNVASVARKPSR